MHTKELVRAVAIEARNRTQSVLVRGDTVWCPVCERPSARFVSRNGGKRKGAVCPHCRSLERHRAFWLFVQRRTSLLTEPARVLHVAPEPHLEKLLRRRPNLDYVTADLLRSDVDMRLDVSSMPEVADDSFDVLVCSHVLEHVPDHFAAMRELLRITRPGGWALLAAPVEEGLSDTYEDWSITAPDARQIAFGQSDHVRRYGTNYDQILAAHGWEVQVVPLPLSDDEAVRFGVPPREQRLYIGTKRGRVA